MQACRSTFPVRSLSFTAVATNGGWRLHVYHLHGDQSKVTCPGDYYPEMSWEEVETCILAVTHVVGEYTGLFGHQLSLDFS